MSYTISLSGILKFDSATFGAFDFLNLQLMFAAFDYKFVFSANDGTVKTLLGRAIVQKSLFGISTGTVLSSDFTLPGVGAYNIYDGLYTPCGLVVTAFIATFVSPGELGMNSYRMAVTYTGSDPFLRFEYSIDGGVRVPVLSGSPFLFLSTSGSHSVTIWPICASGFDGTPKTQTLTLS